MGVTTYRGRQAASIENDRLRVTILREGGHIAELFDKQTGVNPLWTPPWPSIEPSTYEAGRHPEYGGDAESKLLSGLMGHNLCLDVFGPPSEDEAAAGLGVHGEASVLPYKLEAHDLVMQQALEMPMAGLSVRRTLELHPASPVVRIREVVTNHQATDRPVAWTQHVTLGPPFLERGLTQFRLPGTKSQTIEGVAFDWPMKQKEDLRTYTTAESSGGYTAHLLDPHREQAFFAAFHPGKKVVCGYVWHRSDFPWIGIWEENHSRHNAPWNGKTMTRGMEFGVSPIPEPRRKMIERGSLFGVPGYRWLPAKSVTTVEYCAFVQPANAVPEDVHWDGEWAVRF